MKKRLISILLALVLISAMIPFTAAAERGEFKFEQIIPPKYENAGLFYDDLAAVKQNGKWGYINLKDEVVIGFEYDYASHFSEGYAIVGKYAEEIYEEDWVDGFLIMGRVDEKGNYRPLMRYGENWYTGDFGAFPLHVWVQSKESIDDAVEKYYYYNGWVRISNRIFDTNGNEFRTVNNERYFARYVPTEGLIAAWDYYQEEAGLVYMNISGNVVLNLSGISYYDAAGRLIGNSASPNWSWENLEWERVAEVRYYSNGLPFNQGLAFVWESVEKKISEYNWDYSYHGGFINTNGRFVITPQFDTYWLSDSFGEYRIFNDGGLASIGKNGRMGAIDKSNRTVIPFQYDTIRPFSEGLAVYELNGRFGYIDNTGKIVITARFREASGFYNGVAVGYDGSKAFLINRSGNMIPGSDVIDPVNYFRENEEGSVTVYSPGEYVTITSGGRYGFGKISYLPPLPERSEMSTWAYDEVIEAIEADLVPVRLQNMYRNNITRKDFSSLIIHALCEMLDMNRDELVLKKTGKTINDILSDRKFSDSADSDVLIASALGIVLGDPGGTFRPYDQIQRREAAVMLMRAARELGMDISSPARSTFADRGNIPAWAVEGVDYAYSIGVMGGVGGNRFDQNNPYSREQSYMTIIRLLKALKTEQG